MESSNKLAVLDSNVPLKAYTKGQLKEVIYKDFIVWLSAILSLTDEVSAQRLYTAIPAIEKHCWSMGFAEIKKMFTKYADNELSIKPIPNYFDRILFGKIVAAYKQQKPVKKKQIAMPQPTQEEKDALIYHGLITCFDHYIQHREIINGKIWVHDHLDELKLINLTAQEKKILWDKALVNCKSYANNAPDPLQRKSMLTILEQKNSTPRINEYKRLRLAKLFDVLEAKGQHLKEIIK